MKLRLRLVDITEAKPGEPYVLVGTLAPKKNPQHPNTFNQRLALIEVFEPPSLEWQPIELAASEKLLVTPK